jgi:serine-type D-Ala-D-Ala carboxypeptidase/endopeptidase (penicillin-binding protein 4)
MRSSRPVRPARVGAGLLIVTLLSGCAARTPDPLAIPTPVTARQRELRELQRRIAVLVASAPLQRGLVAVHVESLDRGDTLFSYNADRLVVPASNMKILTLAAAAERLGWNYRFQTVLRATGPIVDGVLQGDLLVQGTGDPSINSRDGRVDRLLASWADAVAARGIHAIRGRVTGDGAAFAEADRLGAGWSWDNLPYGYAAPVTGLQINENAVLLTIAPGAAVGLPATVTPARLDTGLTISSEVATAAADTQASISLARLPGSSDLHVTGHVPFGGPVQKRLASVESPAGAFAAALTTALRARGITTGVEPGTGDALTRSHGVAAPHLDPAVTDASNPAGAGSHDTHELVASPMPREQPIAIELSPPLGKLAVPLMKSSQNLYADSLLRALGRAGDAPGTVDAGREALSAVLAAWGVPAGTFVVADGSGLSRYNMVTVRTLVHVLRHVYQDPVSRDPWLSALPVGGTDGTLEKRFKGSAAEGLVHAKTGTIAYVRALSGYVPSAGGEQLVFSIIVNNTTAPGDAVTAVTDGIVDSLAGFER